MEEKIFPNVEYIEEFDIPSKVFLRKTQKLFLKTTDEGLTFTGKTLKWDEIDSVIVKFFNNNPYIQIETKDTVKHSFFFETKFFYRRNKPWFGASKFFTSEFVKILEEKDLFSIESLNKFIEKNETSNLTHQVWNSFFWIFPPLLLFLTIFIIMIGFNADAG